jgi:hypothetical protein
MAGNRRNTAPSRRPGSHNERRRNYFDKFPIAAAGRLSGCVPHS